MTAQFGFMLGVVGKSCQIFPRRIIAEIRRWPQRSIESVEL
jgi:hypothetical protein